MRRELERVEIPGEHDARERARRVVDAAFAERRPVERRPSWRLTVVAAVSVALLAAALSPPGRSLATSVREQIGVADPRPALFSLPGDGRLLVSAASGSWHVSGDGSKRRLGDYVAATWSPHGRFVGAVREGELLALEPDGSVRWSLARRGVESARWSGTDIDTRIAYRTPGAVRIVAGDGTGDRAGCGPGTLFAWAPGPGFRLALAGRDGAVSVYAVEGCRLLWRTPAGPRPTKLEWSSDGRRLLVLAPRALRVYDGGGRLVAQDDPSDATADADATFLAGSHRVAVLRRHGTQSSVFLLASGRVLFRGTGALSQLGSSPDGRWLLVTWPAADQWLFVRTTRVPGVRGVAGISRQFGGSFPRLEGWCCSG